MKRSIFLLLLVVIFVLCFSSLAFGQDIAVASEVPIMPLRGDILSPRTVLLSLPGTDGVVAVIVTASLQDSGTSYGYTFFDVKEVYSDLSSSILYNTYSWRQTKITYGITNNGTKLNVSVEGYLSFKLPGRDPQFYKGSVTFDSKSFYH